MNEETRRKVQQLRERRNPDLPAPAELQRLRRRGGLTQVDLGEVIGVHRVSISRWENGKRNPRGRLLDAYLDVLDALR